MAIAIQTNSVINPTITQESLFQILKRALANVGFPDPEADYTGGSGQRGLAYKITTDASKTRGYFWLRFFVTSNLVIQYRLFADFDTVTLLGTNGSTDIVYPALSTSTQINLTELNAQPEFKFVVIRQGSTVLVVGYLIPTFMPSWWNLNNFPFAFIPTTATFANFYASPLNPYANKNFSSSLNLSFLGTANPVTNRRDVMQGVFLYSATNRGIAAKTSEDLISIAASGLTQFDTVQLPGTAKTYLLLNAAGGLGVRIAT